MMLMIETEQALNDNEPEQPTELDERSMKPNNHTPTSPIFQSNDEKELAIDISTDNTNAPQPDPTTIPKDKTAKPNQTEGIPPHFD